MQKSKKIVGAALNADHTASHALAARRHTPVVRAAAAIGELADQPPLIALSVATIALGILSGRKALARGGTRMLVSHLLSTGVKTAIKRSVDRTRPGTAIATGKTRFRHGHSRDHDQNSFPSGHTAGAVAVAAALAHEFPGAAVAAYAAAGAAAAVQVPSGNHYAIDVAAGAAIGLFGAVVAGALLDAAARALPHGGNG